MPEILLLVAAVGAVLVNVINAWGNRGKLNQVVETTKVIERQTNSAATKAIADKESLYSEIVILRETIGDMKMSAALLAQSVVMANAKKES